METLTINNKAANLIQYINDLSKLKQRPISSYKSYEDIIWIEKDIPNEPEVTDFFRSDISNWLTVKKPVKPKEPILPNNLKDWLMINFYSLTYEIIDEKNQQVINDDNETVIVKVTIDEFLNLKEERKAFIENVWDPYVKEIKRIKNIQDLYDRLFTIYQMLQTNAESLELIVGIGLLQWKLPKQAVERHILINKVELHFDKEKAVFIIEDGAKGLAIEYEEDMLSLENQLQKGDNNEVQKLINEISEEQSLISQIETILNTVANALDSRSQYNDSLTIPSVKNSVSPLISSSPAFILRKKTQKSFQQACEVAVQQLNDNAVEVPTNLANMFNYQKVKKNRIREYEIAKNHEIELPKSKPFYFPLPSNEEQERIIKSLSNKDNVLVQGPPGTGKTHTIANLTAHLLSTGNRVLITSQTAKALSVLKSKLPIDLQALTVSYLGGDSSSIKDLEKVVSTISVNKEQFNLREKELFVEQKEQQLKELKQQLNKTKTELLEIREQETYEHHFCKLYAGTAQQIVKQIQSLDDQYNWYKSDVNLDTTEAYWQLEKKLIQGIIQLNAIYEDIPDEYISFDYPNLLIEKEIKNNEVLFNEEERLIENLKALDVDKNERLIEVAQSLSQEQQFDLINEFERYSNLKQTLLFKTYPHLENALIDVFINRGMNWKEYNEQLMYALSMYLQFENEVEASLFDVKDISLASLKIMSADLTNHLDQGGNLGNFLIKPKVVKQYKDQLSVITYNGQLLKTSEQIYLLNKYVLQESAKQQLKELLVPLFIEEHLMQPVTLKQEVQSIVEQLNILNAIHEWREAVLNKFEVFSPNDFDESFIEQLKNNIQIIQMEKQLLKLNIKFNYISKPIEEVITDKTHSLYKELLEALRVRNSDLVHRVWGKYVVYQEVKKRDETVIELKNKLVAHSPLVGTNFIESMDDRVWQKRLLEWEKAFVHKQVKNWLEAFLLRDEQMLSQKYDELEMQIKQTIIDIGSTKAWINMLKSMTDLQSQHLKAWMKSVKNVGKGTGKNAARYRMEAQMHMEKCMRAIPAWIMPMHQVYDSFEIKPNLFDVVIIDEASQSWHEALLLKFIAKKMIIVGDDKQISPTIIGIDEDDVKKLQTRYFKEIDFDFGFDLNIKNSFFDICYIMFKDTITLREHFRCMPEIIGFSNLISYSDRPLIPLRQYPADRLEPIKTKYLPEGVREGTGQYAFNEAEGDAIVEEITKCLENPQYEGKTFGVISLLGIGQAKHIQNKLLQTIGAEVMEERHIICGDAYSFQGDERDVIFLSMVAAKGERRITALTTESARQRFNVAASRAKDQLWLMHSITINDISNRECLRYQLLSYVANPIQEENESNRMLCESEFEKSVFDAITARGYKVIPQYQVNGYRIDLVVVGEKTRLAVECDGDYWHTSPEDTERDFQREKILQRAGWRFWRILGSKYYHNQDKALESLWVTLEEMGIYPFVEATEQQIDIGLKEVAADIVENGHTSNQTETYNRVKKLLRMEGFEVLQDRPLTNKLYVVGSKLLQRELDYVLPKGIQTTFYQDGLDISEGMPVWVAIINE
ncbi:AAA domain-containing protein [Paenibacillus sp. An7]|uniref:AAA domain-containing protein n=1 Tax=Paenibacillus sp. An7 TaxID=2689577 RepID=UPI00135A3164|nr:AAA domain-containing protein [Paenibacillus sp. An7]